MIFYFTGTGNSRFIAKRVAKQLGEPLCSINEKIKNGDTEKINVSGNLILVTPTYAWQLPNLVQEWILNTTFTGVQKVWILMNCGDSIGKADMYNQELCKKKGWEYMGTVQILMPENYIAMFPVPGREESQKIMGSALPVIDQAISKIRESEKFSEPKSHFYDGFLSGTVHKIFYPMFVKPDAFWIKESCTGCGKCEQLCPLNNIQIREGKPEWGSECTHCMACICACPVEAIEYGKKSRGKNRYYLEE